jgi:pyruvate,water dikinase
MMFLHDQKYTDNALKRYGSKAANLGKLLGEGLRVPNGLVVGPEEVLLDLDRYVDYLQHNQFGVTSPNSTTYAVRSSGLAEDGEDSSYAGQHDTFLHVKSEDVHARVLECRASGVKAEAYREAKGEKDKGIAVLVQRMVPSWLSGVTFTADPFNMALGTSIIEYTLGLGDKLVAGEVNPEGSYEVDNGTGEFTPPLLGTAEILTQVQHQCQRVAAFFGQPMDIEWAVDTDLRAWILQARPLTTGGHRWNFPTLQGRPVVKGRAEGVAVWADTDEPLNTAFDEGNILLAVMTNPHMVPLMMKSSGIATQIGGRTCHAAIVSRELNKPCIVSIGNLHVLPSGTSVVLDAHLGTVQI